MSGEVPAVTVRADRKRLMQVMTNLLSNAAKFSPPNGTVEVSARRVDANVRVEVGDRGPGIPEKFRNRIFARFAQADSADSRIKGGTGLGLAISKRRVEMMQGRVGFEDRAGGGTSFFFELPVMKTGAEAADNAVRVLLTEHDTVTAEYLAMVLEKGGYRVDTAPDAAASKELLGRWQYAAWLVSRRLRDAEDPLALIAEMRERLKRTKIIMLVGGRSGEGGVPEPERHGIVDSMSKTDSRANILEAVEKWIGRVATQPGS
jgi:ActR/RegA family two-component response regulator